MATTTQTNTVSFLDSNYLNCTVNTTNQITPTLATAYQETTGHIDLSNPLVTETNADATVASSNPVTFNVPLSSIVDYTLRRLATDHAMAAAAMATAASRGVR